MTHAPSADPVLASHLSTLAHCVHGLVGRFACGGAIELPYPVTLVFADGTRVVVESGWTTKTGAAMQAIKRRCKPAPYGHGRATRYDHNVRHALQLRAEDAFTVEGFGPEALGVLDVIRTELAPDDTAPLTAELYGLNLYETNGHFVPHKDTPRGDDMLGTLVACLPVQFMGGALVLTHRGATQTFGWNRARAAMSGQNTVEWAAFFGDIDHEVQEVRAGNRLTITWILRRSANAPSAPRPRTVEFEALVAALRGALDDSGFLPNGGVLGFPCVHMYAEDTNFIHVSTPLSAAKARKLKGRDERVACAASHLGLAVRLQPYLVENCGDEKWRLSRFPTAQEASVFERVQVDLYDLEDSMPIERALGDAGDAVYWALPDVESRTLARGERQGASAATKLLGEPEFSATSYFGNEGSPTGFYMYAALLVTVPPQAEREGLAVRSKTG